MLMRKTAILGAYKQGVEKKGLTHDETGTILAAAGSFVAFLCGWDDAMTALLVLMGVDYVTGVLTAFADPERVPRSKRGFLGICKKVMVLAVVALAHFVSDLVGNEAARTLVVWFFVGNEGLSILENAANAGVPVPGEAQRDFDAAQEREGGA